jgi:NitT/TauT family transport system ATP-binding protein
MAALLEVRDVSKVFERDGKAQPALMGVTMQVQEGEFVAVVGPSGCGKSTLLRIVMGLELPTSGQVLYRGRPLGGLNLRAAMAFQTFALIPWLNVKENVALGLEARRLDPEEIERRVTRYLELMELKGFEDAYPRELSGGMKQRVGLARALAVEPELLCLDEPFSSLDALTAQTLRDEFLDLWLGKRTGLVAVLMITHLIEEAVYMADRVVIMSRRPGKILDHVTVDLPRPRNRRSSQFEDLCDAIYARIL